MGRRWLLLCALGVGLILGLTACMELLTGAKTPTLILGEVRLFEGRGEILLSVECGAMSQGMGPGALVRPQEGSSGSVKFRLDPSWWSELSLSELE